MGMLGSNSGLIGAARPQNAIESPGVWTVNEHILAIKANKWPLSGGQRYWRMDSFATNTLDGTSLDLTEIKFWAGDSLFLGITASSNLTWAFGGSSSTLTDGVSSTSNRALINGTWNSTEVFTARIDFDFGQPRRPSHIEVHSLYGPPRFPQSFRLSASSVNGSGYVTVATLTVGTSFTALGGNVFTTGLVAIP